MPNSMMLSILTQNCLMSFAKTEIRSKRAAVGEAVFLSLLGVIYELH